MSVGIARKQKVFAVQETTIGTMVFPSGTGATLGFIRTAGDSVLNQSPAFVDSEEKVDSLDVLDRFQGATPPGDFTLPTYVRPGSTYGQLPQADAVWQSLIGKRSTRASCTYITDSATEASAIFYLQTTSAPSFSLWVETDHFVQGMSGCTAQQGVLGVNNEGAVMMTFTGQGMQMVWAGTSALDAEYATGLGTIGVDDADIFSAGAYIQNSTKGYTNGGAGYLISSSNSTTNELVLSSALGSSWATDDVIKGYLPVGTTIGTPLEGVDTVVTMDSVEAKFKNSDLTFDCPKQYLMDEVGTSYPEEYVEDTRSITSTLDIYFKAADARYFAEGYKGNNIPIRLTFGKTAGQRLIIHMQKCNLEVPTVAFSTPTVDLSMPMKALGTDGEDSAEVVFG